MSKVYKALWNGQTLAESSRTITIEGNIYFPPDSLKREFFSDSKTHTVCPWKGVCSYYNVTVAGEVNTDAAWYYHEPKPGSGKVVAQQNGILTEEGVTDENFSFSDYVAFWNGVEIVEG